MRTTYGTQWKEIPKNVRLAYRRIGWGWATVMHRSVSDPDSFLKWQKYARPELGVCAGVSEAQGTISFYKDFFEERVPFESDLGELVTKSAFLLSSMNRVCGLSQFVTLLESEIEEKESIFSSEYLQGYVVGPHSYLAQIPLNPARIPYVRRMFGMFLMTAAIPSFDSIYVRGNEPEV